MKNKIVTRFAPSPTGFMHVGGIRTALFAWAFARKQNGIFILRIEDTDKEREVAGSKEQIMEALKWLGIDWNEGPDIGGPNAPYTQSERLASYKKYAAILIEKGYAYADPYSEEELDAFRKKSEELKKPFLYREHRPENPPVWNGKVPLRLKTPEIKSYKWIDEVRGELSAGPEALDDFVLIKSDGYPTYNFAHVIDDIEMKVTHIFRGDEFISSTPKFLSLYEALGVDHPKFVTLPPIMGPDGKKKLGKRDGAKDILEYRNDGYMRDAMMNFLAFIGWNPGGEKEIFSPEEFVKEFSIEHIQRAGGKFNIEKLDWINKEHLKLLSEKEKVESVKNYLEKYKKDSWSLIDIGIGESKELNHSFVNLITERVKKWGDIKELVSIGELDCFFEEPILKKELIIWKKDKDALMAITHLNEASKIIENLEEGDCNAKIIKEKLMVYAEKGGKGSVLWPLRYALSGKEQSPDPFVLIEILGKSKTLHRWKKAKEILEN